MKRTTNEQRSVAYFSMETGIDEKISTYSGGLGILAGDTFRSAPFRELFDQYIPLWKEDNFSLRYALNIPKDDVWNTHPLSLRGTP